MSVHDAAAERALNYRATRVGRGYSCRSCHLKIIQNNRRENSFCAIIAQNPPFFLSDLADESFIVIFDCAQGGAILSNKCAIILSDT
jgi:hypothetical protein